MRVGKQAGTGNATARPARRDARRDEERDEAIGHGAVSKQESPMMWKECAESWKSAADVPA